MALGDGFKNLGGKVKKGAINIVKGVGVIALAGYIGILGFAEFFGADVVAADVLNFRDLAGSLLS